MAGFGGRAVWGVDLQPLIVGIAGSKLTEGMDVLFRVLCR
jgi:hypothetical protein